MTLTLTLPLTLTPTLTLTLTLTPTPTPTLTSRADLEGLTSARTVAALWRLPRMLYSQRESGVLAEGTDAPADRWGSPEPCTEPEWRVEVFVRRYSRGTRPLMSFHRDACAVTVNVALSDDAAHSGGRLLAVLDDGVQVLKREAGQATVHPSDVLHAVSAMEAGVRYSLLLFFYNPPCVVSEDGIGTG